MTCTLIASACTFVGRRKRNEDAYVLDAELGLFAVADGMGGYSGGEVASHIAVTALAEFWAASVDGDNTWPYALDRSLGRHENRIDAAVRLANRRICERRTGELRNMGSTVVMLAIRPGKAICGHLGDSRIYRLRRGDAGPRLTQLTRDHSLYEQLREAGTPVVASMGAVAASGGYYVAMAADTIVANPATITGSIGVVTGKLVARELKDRLGVGSDTVRTNTNADAWSPNAPFTAEQHAMVEAEADLFYDDFVNRVAQARGMSTAEVDAVARGRVWTGADARERGLVDELGGLRTAVRRAKVLAGLDPDTEVSLVSYPGSSWRDYLRHRASTAPAASLSDAAASLIVSSVAGLIERGERHEIRATGDGRRALEDGELLFTARLYRHGRRASGGPILMQARG